MLELDSTPPPNPDGQSLPIRRTPAAGTVTATVTSRRLLGTSTHYWGGRTVPCSHEPCDACSAGAPYRWHAYMAAYDFQRQLHFLFEVTAAGAEAFVKFAAEHESLRGCTFRASRAGKRQNSRVLVETNVFTGQPQTLPREPDLVAALSRLWNVPVDQITTPDIKRTQVELSVLDEQIATRRLAAASRGNGERS